MASFMNEITREEIADRFMRYASICTQSAEGCETTPSTDCQRNLAGLLYRELAEMGASDVIYDEEHCYVYATLPGNIPVNHSVLDSRKDRTDKKRENAAPILGLIAHMDTSDAVSATEFHPHRIDSYDGGRVVLDEKEGIVSDPSRFPDLKKQTGNMLVVTDGHSVLGGDDKAGITAIMEVFRFYLKNPDYPHGTVRLCFTPDEEVGNGPLNLDQTIFAVDCAYTVDGSQVGELSYQNFNAATAKVHFKGVSTHPGDAKGTMRNALLMAMEYNSLLPEKETPFYTEGYEGFYHLDEMRGTVDEADCEYLIRDHDRQNFEKRKEVMRSAARLMNVKYSADCVRVKIGDSYYNMEEKILPHRDLIDNAVLAMRESGVEPQIVPIRGGTDGCMLSFKGIPCPNLGTGAYRYHSRYEYVSIDEMKKNIEIIIRLLGEYARYEITEGYFA